MDSSPLALLPKELRLLIYTFVFSQPEPITITIAPTRPSIRLALLKHIYQRSRTYTQAQEPNLPELPKPDKWLALTETCRQIRYESLPMLLEGNVFRICNAIPLHNTYPENTSAVVSGIEEWLENVGPSWERSLRKVEVDTNKSWLGPVESDIPRFIGVLKAVKAVFENWRNLKLRIIVKTSRNFYGPVQGDVRPFVFCFDGRGFDEMVEELRKGAEAMEREMQRAPATRQVRMRECGEKLKRILDVLEDDPEWDWS